MCCSCFLASMVAVISLSCSKENNKTEKEIVVVASLECEKIII